MRASFSTAVTTLVGQSLGAGKPKLAVKVSYKGFWATLIALTGVGAILFFFAKPILGFFTPDPAVIELGSVCLMIIAVFQPLESPAWLFGGTLRGAGDTKWLFYITALTTWGVRALGGFICVIGLHLGVWAVVVCTGMEALIRGILVYARFKTGKWQLAVQDHHTEKIQAAQNE